MGIEDLHKHDFRHAYVTRSILAGIPPAVVLKASGHSTDEWKRYLNVTPDMLHHLFTPLEGQKSEAVKDYGFEVMRQLTEALWDLGSQAGTAHFSRRCWLNLHRKEIYESRLLHSSEFSCLCEF